MCVCVDFDLKDFCIFFQLPNGVGNYVKFIH